MAEQKYLVTAGVVSGPNDAHYQGQEVTADELGVGPDRIEHLLEQGAIEKVAADQGTGGAAAGSTPAKSGAADGAGAGDDAPQSPPPVVGLTGTPGDPKTAKK